MIRVYMQTGKTVSKQFCDAFAAGCGGKVYNEMEYQPGRWAGYGSPLLWDNLQRTIRDGHDFYYGDHGYFGRGKFFRVTKNAYQHDGLGETPDLRRLRPFHEAEKPWRKGGKHVLVCTQTQAYYERIGEPNWLKDTLVSLAEHTDRPIVVREKFTKKPLMSDFQFAHVIVAHSSNVLVEALMEGIPIIATGKCAASVMGQKNISMVEKPLYPDGRMEWAGVLAANQWTFDEMKRGVCWEKIQ